MRHGDPERGEGGRWRGAGAALLSSAIVALLWPAGGCTDPRPRPVPPTVQITLSTSVPVTSPGHIVGSIYAYDASGLDSIVVSVHSADDHFIEDSVYYPQDPFEDTHPLHWHVPPGLPARVGIQVVARAVSYIGFVAADTALTIVQDTTLQRR